MQAPTCDHCRNPVGLLSMEIVFRDARAPMSVCRTCWTQEYGSPEGGSFPVQEKKQAPTAKRPR